MSGSGIAGPYASLHLAPDRYATPAPHHSVFSFFTGRMPFLPPNQQRQSTEDTTFKTVRPVKYKTVVG